MIGEPRRHALRLDFTSDNLGRPLADREEAKEKENKRNIPKKENQILRTHPCLSNLILGF